MPERKTLERAAKDARQGKAPTTQAGEFIREEIKHVREGKHGARSTKQLIAIGLSKARRAGVKLPPPKNGNASERTLTQTARDYRKGQRPPGRTPSRGKSRAETTALKREGKGAASHTALARHARTSAKKRGAANLARAARNTTHTKGTAKLKKAARRAAQTQLGRVS
jgi:hypothetical protein